MLQVLLVQLKSLLRCLLFIAGGVLDHCDASDDSSLRKPRRDPEDEQIIGCTLRNQTFDRLELTILY